MPSTLDLCQEFYGTKDIYKLFEVEKGAPENEIKKAYYKLSLKVHPDRVPEDEKKVATEKFKTVSKIYNVLVDKDKRALYDEKGVIDEDDDDSCHWLSMWQQFFKPITNEDISNFEKSYVGSELEINDVKKCYLNGKGCINFMMNTIPFMDCKDEPRIAKIVQDLIAANEVPEYKIFTKEPKGKRDKRHKKYAREAREAAMLKEKLEKKSDEQSLEQKIAVRQADRGSQFMSLIDSLASKYGAKDEDDEDYEEDDSKSISISDYLNATSSKKRKTKKKNKNLSTKTKEHKVLKGRVSK